MRVASGYIPQNVPNYVKIIIIIIIIIIIGAGIAQWYSAGLRAG
jgi:hypothetical protein